MSPLKRVLAAIVALFVLMIGGLFLSWHLQERELARTLVNDIEATFARPIERTPPPESAKHENGFACLAAAMAAAPSDLRPIDFKDQNAFHEIIDAGVVPEAWAPKIVSLEPWVESVRSCGDSRNLAFVPEVNPFESFDDAKKRPRTLPVIAATRMTRLQARTLAPEQAWGSIARHCVATLELALDYGHISLIGAMVAAGTLQSLAIPCAEALQRLSPSDRPPLAARFARLPSRFVSNSELIETERLSASLNTYRRFLSAEQRARVPSGDDWLADSEDRLGPFIAPRVWSRWDRAMRQLVVAARDPGPARQAASRALDDVFASWWVVGSFSGAQPNYEKFFLRNDDARVLLNLIVELAAGAEITLSAQLVKTAEGLEFTRSGGGEKLVIPLVH